MSPDAADADVLWRPPLDGGSRLERLVARLGADLGRDFAGYEDFRAWALTDLDRFWLEVWQEFDLPSATPPTVALADAAMPGAVWFPEVSTNYAEAMLRLPGREDDDVVVVSRSQTRADVTWTASRLRADVAAARRGLQRLGVGRGDRVGAYAPNIGETVVLLLAAAGLGAVFVSCAPEFGVQSVLDRLRQVEPAVLVAVDGYRYGSKEIDRREQVARIAAELPGLRQLVVLPYLATHPRDATPLPEGAIGWDDLLSEPGPLEFDRVPFDHPLYVLFSSGTTGLPKAIVHGHGGIMLAHCSAAGLCTDLGPADRFFWFSTTGWMMWNYLVSGLGVGATVVLFDGDPAYPDLGMLWELAAELGLTYFGTSAPYLLSCRKQGLRPRDVADLSALRGIGSTGAPLPVEGFRWVYDAVGADLQLGSMSGGTDVCTAFVGSTPMTPVVAGEISCRLPGCAVEAFDRQRRPVTGRLGELVITEPMPSMPVGFWNDPSGERYRDAYFAEIPGVWRHGDWITVTERGTCVITGRSDATLNRGGVRLGTAEFYSVAESLDGVLDSLVVHLEDDEGGAGELLLFVVLAQGAEADDVTALLRRELRTRLSPRHVPDAVHVVPAVPKTLSGKKLEVPVKRILQGTPATDAASAGSLQDPSALDPFVALHGTRTLRPPGTGGSA